MNSKYQNIAHIRFSVSASVGPLLLALLAFACFCNHPINSDEGNVLNGAWQIWNGKLPYIDFMELSPPGSMYLVWASWKLFGSSYLTAKLVSIGFWLLSASALYACVSEGKRRDFAGTLLLVWLLCCLGYPIVNYNSHSTFTSIIVLFLLLRTVETQNNFYGFLLGAALGFTFLFLHTKGLSLLAGVVFCLLLFFRSPRSSLGATLGAVCISCLIVVGLGFYLANPQAMFKTLFILPFEMRYLSSSLFELDTALISAIVIGIMATASWKIKSRRCCILTVFQTMLILSTANNFEVHHLVINIFPFLLFLVEIVPDTSSNCGIAQSRYIRRATTFLFYLCFFILGAKAVRNFTGDNLVNIDILGKPRGGIFAIKELREARTVFFGPFSPGLYFELRKPNPFTEISVLMLCDRPCQERLRAIFERERPEYAVVNYSYVARFGYTPENQAGINLVEDYLSSHYSKCGRIRDSGSQLLALSSCPVDCCEQ